MIYQNRGFYDLTNNSQCQIRYLTTLTGALVADLLIYLYTYTYIFYYSGLAYSHIFYHKRGFNVCN